MVGSLEVEAFSWQNCMALRFRGWTAGHLLASSFQGDEENLEGWLCLERHDDVVPNSVAWQHGTAQLNFNGTCVAVLKDLK